MCVAVQDDLGNHKDVFLYNKAHLRQNVALPAPEATSLPRADGKLADTALCHQGSYSTFAIPCNFISLQ